MFGRWNTNSDMSIDLGTNDFSCTVSLLIYLQARKRSSHATKCHCYTLKMEQVIACVCARLLINGISFFFTLTDQQVQQRLLVLMFLGAQGLAARCTALKVPPKSKASNDSHKVRRPPLFSFLTPYDLWLPPYNFLWQQHKLSGPWRRW